MQSFKILILSDNVRYLDLEWNPVVELPTVLSVSQLIIIAKLVASIFNILLQEIDRQEKVSGQLPDILHNTATAT